MRRIISTKRPAQMLHIYIDVFEDILVKLQELGGNVVLAGSQILEVHGLDLNRTVDDLDIVLYDITDEQKKFIDILAQTENVVGTTSPSAMVEFLKTKDQKDPNDKTEVKEVSSIIKIERPEGYQLNILSEIGPVPDYCLKYVWNRGTGRPDRPVQLIFDVQPIHRIISAKRSYTYESTTRGKYVRLKDIVDFQQLRSNFEL